MVSNRELEEVVAQINRNFELIFNFFPGVISGYVGTQPKINLAPAILAQGNHL